MDPRDHEASDASSNVSTSSRDLAATMGNCIPPSKSPKPGRKASCQRLSQLLLAAEQHLSPKFWRYFVQAE